VEEPPLFVEVPVAVEEASLQEVPMVPAEEPSAIAGEPETEVPEPESNIPAAEIARSAENLPISHFPEIWAYLTSGSENYFKTSYPLSDIGYFGATFDSYGKLTDIPSRGKLSSFKGRVHMVVTCDARALTHFVLEPGSKTRQQALADLLEVAKPFEGLQIDFEYIPARDGEAFLSFLRELRTGLGDRWLTIALPARTRTLADDVYDYRKILPIVDRILVMAYDEHWSTSAPGPIASTEWCRRIVSYALQTIGSEKLIMGLPFYGRTWGDVSANKAYLFSSMERVKREHGITDLDIKRTDGVPYFSYTTTMTVTGYYEDAISLSAKLEMYRKAGVCSVGFWTLGQETPAVWSILRLGD
jgi:hypothetical protein